MADVATDVLGAMPRVMQVAPVMVRVSGVVARAASGVLLCIPVTEMAGAYLTIAMTNVMQ